MQAASLLVELERNPEYETDPGGGRSEVALAFVPRGLVPRIGDRKDKRLPK